MKIYAKQVPPEYQESPLFMEEWPENVFVFGNKWLTDHAGRLEDIKRTLEDISDVCNGYGYTNNLLDVIPGRDDGRKYTRPELLQLVRLAKNFTEYSNNSDDENEILCDVLELITGRAWDYCTLRGCCQGDWQECIYPADDWDGDALERLEAEYFNTGTEWIVHDGDTTPDGPEDINGFSVYCTAWNSDGIRQEIADAAGVDLSDVILYTFTDWSKTPEYMEV